MIRNTIVGLRGLAHPVVVVDDGSGGATAAIVAESGAHLIRHVINLGQGAALRTGIEFALARGASHICTFDADGQHNPDSIADLVSALLLAGADVALGSRTLGEAAGIPRMRKWMLGLACIFTRFQTGLNLSDVHNGLRLLSRRAALAIRLDQPRMAHASEILTEISRLKLRYVEVPTTIRYSSYSLRKGQSMMGSVRIILDLIYAAWTR